MGYQTKKNYAVATAEVLRSDSGIIHLEDTVSCTGCEDRALYEGKAIPIKT